jgi:taurine dioxygenase
MAQQHRVEETAFSINPLSDVAGAEVVGLDLSQPFDEAVQDALLDALQKYHVLAFRDQDLSEDQQLAMTMRFGELDGHVSRTAKGKSSPKVHLVCNLDTDGNPSGAPATFGSFYWHTDKSYHDVPSFATFLHARELPPAGGDTEFANMLMAYDALDEATRERIKPLRAVHSWEANRRNSGNRPATEAEKLERPPVSHPIVRTHPDRGRKSLYLGIHTSHVEGMPVEDGERLLTDLLVHATQRRFVYVHEWHPGDLVMWDNRCLLHRVVGNYDMNRYRRVLHRTVVKGVIPV